MGQGEKLFVAFAVALLWAMHPLQTESVTCVIQRTESLCGLFYLLTLYAFVRGAEQQAEESHAPVKTGMRAGFWYVLSILACLAGMVTKEVMVTAPVIVWLFDRTFVTGGFVEAWRRRRGFYLGLVGTWALLLWLVIRSGASRGTAAGFGVGMSSWSYALKQCEALVLYLKLSLWPHPLVLDYGTAVPASLSEVGWQAVVVVSLLLLTLWALVRKPVLGFLGAWFFLILAPSSSVLPLAAQTMAEHRMYLPLAAPIVIVVFAVSTLARLWSALLVVGAGVCLGVMTWQRNVTYHSELDLWSADAAHYSAGTRVLVNLGNALLDSGRLSEALDAYERAEKLNPNSPELQSSLCLALSRNGRLSEALEHGEAALRLDPKYANAQVNLAHVLQLLHRGNEAAEHFQAALSLQPEALDLRIALADALLEVGRVEDAISQLEQALGLEARRAEVHRKLAQAFVKKGDHAMARRHAAEALRLDPKDAEAHFVSGNLCAYAEDFPAAIEEYRQAVLLEPGYAAARNNLANALLVTGQLDAAIIEYREVLTQRPDDRSVQENLQRAIELKAAASGH